MFQQIRVTFDLKDNARPQYFWAYHLYSALVEKMPTDLAIDLHSDGLKPINHYLLLPGPHSSGDLTWVINLLGEEIITGLLPVIEGFDSLYLRHYETVLQVSEVITDPVISEKDFATSHLINGFNHAGIKLRFLSPASFRSNEEYQLFPSIEWIIKSAIQKWNSYSSETVIDDPEALEHLISHSHISGYSLWSYYYRLKGVKIPGFMGFVNLEARGPQPMIGLWSMIISFLAYSGVGIKCGLGMGGCSVEKLPFHRGINHNTT